MVLWLYELLLAKNISKNWEWVSVILRVPFWNFLSWQKLSQKPKKCNYWEKTLKEMCLKKIWGCQISWSRKFPQRPTCSISPAYIKAVQLRLAWRNQSSSDHVITLSVSKLFLDALASLKTMFKIHSDTHVFKISRLQSIREYCWMLQSVTECYEVLQSVTECYRVLQSVTDCYRVLQSEPE